MEVGQDPGLEREWIRQINLTYVALLAIALVMVQPFLTAGYVRLEHGKDLASANGKKLPSPEAGESESGGAGL